MGRPRESLGRPISKASIPMGYARASSTAPDLSSQRSVLTRCGRASRDVFGGKRNGGVRGAEGTPASWGRPGAIRHIELQAMRGRLDREAGTLRPVRSQTLRPDAIEGYRPSPGAQGTAIGNGRSRLVRAPRWGSRSRTRLALPSARGLFSRSRQEIAAGVPHPTCERNPRADAPEFGRGERPALSGRCRARAPKRPQNVSSRLQLCLGYSAQHAAGLRRL